MTKKVRESKERLNKEHSTLLEAFQVISDSGLVKFIASVIIAACLILWRQEVTLMKVSDIAATVSHHGDSLKAHTGLWHRIPPKDTVYSIAFVPKRSKLTKREQELENYYKE